MASGGAAARALQRVGGRKARRALVRTAAAFSAVWLGLPLPLDVGVAEGTVALLLLPLLLPMALAAVRKRRRNRRFRQVSGASETQTLSEETA